MQFPAPRGNLDLLVANSQPNEKHLLLHIERHRCRADFYLFVHRILLASLVLSIQVLDGGLQLFWRAQLVLLPNRDSNDNCQLPGHYATSV